MSRRERRVPHVAHATRPDLGVGEVNDVIRGKPPVVQVYWTASEKYGYYLITDLRRVAPDGTIGDIPAFLEENG